MLKSVGMTQKLISGVLGIASASVLVGVPVLAQMKPMTPGDNSGTVPKPMTPGSMTAPGSMSSPGSLSTIDRQFMTKAAHSDQTEIQTSKLALQKSSSQSVRSFAQQMIQQHTNSTQQLMQIAMQRGVTLPKDVGPDNKPLLTQLSGLSGTAFDRAYMAGQVKAHTKTQAEIQRYLKQGQDPAVKAFASRIAPIVAGHLQMAQSMVAQR